MFWKLMLSLCIGYVANSDCHNNEELAMLRRYDLVFVDSYTYAYRVPMDLRNGNKDRKISDASVEPRTLSHDGDSTRQHTRYVVPKYGGGSTGQFTGAAASASPPMPPLTAIPREHSPVATSKIKSSDRFSTSLIYTVALPHASQNIVYSPISLQTLLTYIYTGARGTTADELQKGLQVPKNKEEVILELYSILKSQSSHGEAQIIMANKMYHAPNLSPTNELSNIAQNYFNSEIEEINFTPTNLAAQQINNWVSKSTQNHIQNLIEPSSLNAQTKAILVNAIYFKAKWEKEFSASESSMEDFNLNARQTKSVWMMFNSDTFRYADFPTLGVQVLELPYNNSDISMMIILPHEVEGLATVEQRLSSSFLADLSASLTLQPVTVRLPRFEIEFDIDMVQPLKAIGINTLFTPQSNLNGLFQNPVKIDKVQHKAYIKVNEAGSEAAAASFAKLVPLSLPPKVIYFNANRPFLFAIRGPKAVYFVGHVVSP